MLSRPQVQYTIAAFYGSKPSSFVAFVDGLRKIIQQHPLGMFFQPYANEQIHTTLMGLERLVDGELCVNLNIYESLGEKRPIKLIGCLDVFEYFLSGVQIRLGGFNPTNDQFLSWDERPYQRSFGIHPSTGKVVLNGWPMSNQGVSMAFSDCIWQLRKRLYQEHNLRHKYHQYADNDVFMVIGDIVNPHQPATEKHEAFLADLEGLQKEVRAFLSTTSPYYFPIDLEDLALIAYEDPRLPVDGSKRYPIHLIRADISRIYDLLLN
ncbi:MAG: hypothetical protein HKN87_01595 [Saprospiraceae bacterium]|nr:hypothetical protein [Saprospiraceae bacterium]